ncbi:MAG: shikimate dehydrogenase [Lachnospiraceae bacterium]|nr:shikimate dehydrogenase [Lachnospiraceae bacterium]
MEYGLIGEKLSHSYSKEIHEKIADYDYEIHPVAKEDLDSFMTEKPFSAINVTIPYKEKVIPYLDELDTTAETIGAVNTIVCEDGKYKGYNTDFGGFMYMLKKHNIDVTGKKVLILGKGGAHKAVAAVLKALKASDIITVYYKEAEDSVTYELCKQLHTDASVIINTTPVGMYPNTGVSPIDLTCYPDCEAVVDLIYNPLETEFLKQGKALGMTAVCGLEMLVAQAVYASEYFRKIKLYDTDEQYIQLIDKVTDEIKQIMTFNL